MSNQEKTGVEGEGRKLTGLDLLRAPFPASHISKLPKPTRRQTDLLKEDFKRGIRCKECGGWHHPDVVHLDYVGHAALTDRLLDADPMWNWEPVSFSDDGTPATDSSGGMWIRLTVCNVTRLGYGHADGKRGGDAIKELIGDALRNAAMRFGAALDLWHKGDLHAIEASDAEDESSNQASTVTPDQFITLRDAAEAAGVAEDKICAIIDAPSFQQFPAARFDWAMKKLAKTIEENAAKEKLDGDNIPDFGEEK